MILTVGIKGIKSSSHKTLNTIKHDCAKLVLDTDRAAAPAVLTDEIRSGKYSKVVIFCEKYGLSDKITAEIAAMSDEGLITTDFCCSDAVLFFRSMGFGSYLSSNAGKSWGNLLYSAALKCVRDECPDVSVILLHIPRIDKISNKKRFMEAIEGFLDYIEDKQDLTV